MILEKFKMSFIKKLTTFFTFLSTPFWLFADIIQQQPTNTDNKNNSLSINEPSGWNTQELIKEFENLNEGVKQYLNSVYKDEKISGIVTQNALKQYKALVIELPNVGGKLNKNSQFLNIAAWYLAYYRAMKPFGKTPEDVGKMIYQLNKIQWKNFPKDKAKLKCEAFFSAAGKESLKQYCEWTQKSQYPANWKAEYVAGDNENFDFGYNYTHCGVCMYLYAYNASELAPFVCTNDFLESTALNTGLTRTKTIATGDSICDFRFKKDKEVRQSWDTEIEKIRNCIKTGKLYQP